jgi:elongator complex protein 3
MRAARAALQDVRAGSEVMQAVRRYPLPQGGYLGKHHLVSAYRSLVDGGEWPADPALLRRLQMKPVRTSSGVTTVTVLTKPYPCPGKCVFCPTDARMPKSYLPDEPGAARALENDFDPFRQTASRLEALAAIGHPTDKVELLILGGTWSAYPRSYQAWFVQRCLDAMNGFDAIDLGEAQRANESALHRNVGLVIETRPDHVDGGEVAFLRSLGVTKVQLGAQSLDDAVLLQNQRGHTVDDLRRGMRQLRRAGFKLVLHWMPNLLGATPASDRLDFARLWSDTGLRPDELKIYPCQLLENAELFEVWRSGGYIPYSTEELIDLLADVKPTIPEYCRVNRVIRDIPSTHVVEGNRRTSLRQDAQLELRRRGTACRCIRCREVRQRQIDPARLTLRCLSYPAGEADEEFLSLVTTEDRLAGYARLSLPSGEPAFPELDGAALLRELHVVGPSLEFGRDLPGAAQHAGLGARLLARAEARAAESGFARLAVISALGTRHYYHKLGYSLAGTYMVRDLPTADITR